MSQQSISVIIPSFNEGHNISLVIESVGKLGVDEIIVVDASTDTTSIATIDQLVSNYFDYHDIHILRSQQPGRAVQMNQGALASHGDILLFLHVDTILPEDAITALLQHVSDESVWGRFMIQLDASGSMFRLISYMINLRSRLRTVATGDQAIFISRKLFESIGGYPEIPLMEDIAISKKLARIKPPLLLSPTVITSARRWQQNGIWSTILLMWLLRFLFWIGVPAKYLAKLYRYGK